MQKKITIAAASALFASLVVAAPAQAQSGTVDIGGGWMVYLFDPGISISTLSVTSSRVTISMSTSLAAQNLPPFAKPQLIAFEQTGDETSTVPQIAIAQQALTNASGVDWNSYKQVLLLSGAWFDTAASSGYTIEPFTSVIFTNSTNNANKPPTEAHFVGGTVRAGSTWRAGEASGSLVINADVARGDLFFYLEQFPAPAPGPVAMGALGAIVALRRRR